MTGVAVKHPKLNLKQAQQPVVMFGGAIGDHLMILPALRALARLFPQNLGWLGLPAALTDFYSDVHFGADFSGYLRVEAGRIALDVPQALAALQGCDLLISLSTWHSPETDDLLKGLPAAVSLGYYPQFQNAVGLDQGIHMFDIAFKLVLQIEPQLRLEDFAQPPVLKELYHQRARQLRQALPAGSKVLVVHADTKPEKRWPTARFVATLDLFLQSHPEFVVWVIGTEDLKLNSGPQGGKIRRYLRLPLGQAMALVSEADLFLGIDSCMLHVADLFRVPGVGLFGPTSPAEWGFRFGPHHHQIGSEGQLETIEPREVLAALESLLSTGL
jgi:ADP-heptose:LPS heptosyltransferase